MCLIGYTQGDNLKCVFWYPQGDNVTCTIGDTHYLVLLCTISKSLLVYIQSNPCAYPVTIEQLWQTGQF